MSTTPAKPTQQQGGASSAPQQQGAQSSPTQQQGSQPIYRDWAAI